MERSAALAASGQTTFGVLVILDENEYCSKFHEYLAPEDPVRTVSYVRSGGARRDLPRVSSSRDWMAVKQPGDGVQTPPTNLNFRIKQDNSLLPCISLVSGHMPSQDQLWTVRDSLVGYANTPASQRPRFMLRYAAAAMLHLCGRPPELPLTMHAENAVPLQPAGILDRHLVVMKQGIWHTSKRLVLQCHVPVPHFVRMAAATGDATALAPLEVYAHMQRTDLQMLLPGQPHVFGPYLSNSTLHSPSSEDLNTHFFQVPIDPPVIPGAGAPARASKGGSTVVWYGSRHAPVLLAVPAAYQPPPLPAAHTLSPWSSPFYPLLTSQPKAPSPPPHGTAWTPVTGCEAPPPPIPFKPLAEHQGASDDSYLDIAALLECLVDPIAPAPQPPEPVVHELQPPERVDPQSLVYEPVMSEPLELSTAPRQGPGPPPVASPQQPLSTAPATPALGSSGGATRVSPCKPSTACHINAFSAEQAIALVWSLASVPDMLGVLRHDGRGGPDEWPSGCAVVFVPCYPAA